jgi:hypothetical protein
MTQPSPLLLSIVIEWENAGRIGASRAHRMLAELHAQLLELQSGRPVNCEIIVPHDPEKVARAIPAEAMRAVTDGAAWPAELRFVEIAGGDYYQQKNAGAALARGDLLLFVDSDVVPESGWLQSLIQAFASPGIDVVGGNTFVEPEGFYAKAVALLWFFPLRSNHSGIVATSNFYANNVAFRRATFERHNFPSSGQFRGQCAALAEDLTRSGHHIWLSHDAQVAHPPPAGLGAFLLRALWNGHDDCISARFGRRNHLAGGLRSIGARFLGALIRIRRDRARVGLGPTGAIAAMGVAALYYCLDLMGFLATLVAPGLVRRALQRTAGG